MKKKNASIIEEPEGVVFVVENKPPSKKDQKMISDFIKKSRIEYEKRLAKKAKQR